jgi:hypothetical protein
MPQVHCNIDFQIVSQRFNNDDILMEQACANIKNKYIAEIWYFKAKIHGFRDV